MRKKDPYKYLREKYHATPKYQHKLAWSRTYRRERYKTLKEHGICVRCGIRDAQKDRVMCTECLLERNQLYGKALEVKDKDLIPYSVKRKSRYNERKAAGICVRCGKKKAVSGYVACRNCLEKAALSRAMAKKRRIDAFWKENIG